MKAHIDRSGTLVLEAYDPTEEYALRRWLEDVKFAEDNQSILQTVTFGPDNKVIYPDRK
jgi:hypothetical protein